MQPILPIAFLLQGLALGLTAAASPGPFQAFLISKTLTGGWRQSAPIAFAPLISDGPIILIVLILLNQLPGIFLHFVSLAGGLFVLYLAWNLWKRWQREASEEIPFEENTGGSGLWRGVLMNALSPGPYTFWTLVNGPLLLSALRQSWWHGGAFLLGFYGTLIGGMLGIAALFHQARRLGPRVVRGLTLGSIVILVIFGIVLVKGGIG
jgi:threonine/homoserine/homoserine lactone efflux protein